MLRARPSWAICATLFASAFVSTASVATTAIVVAAPVALLGSSRAGSSPRLSARIVPTSRVPSAVRAPATTRPVRGSTTSPTALTATSAATVMPPTSTDAVPMPPFIARPMPNSLPTEAPAPAPTLPSASESRDAASQAAWPAAASGRMRGSPTQRSNRIAAGTIGTTKGVAAPSAGAPMVAPMPRSSSQRMTPPAASRPNALPPARTTACTLSIALTGSSNSVSRVPGEAPRTSTPATAPARAITTVQPVGRRASVKWPTSRPATAVKPNAIGRSAGRAASSLAAPPRRAANATSVGASSLGEHAGGRLHAARHLADLEQRVAEGHLDHRQALEVVARGVLVGDADAAVQLDALLADEAHRVAELHLRLCQRAPPWRRLLAELERRVVAHRARQLELHLNVGDAMAQRLEAGDGDAELVS